MEHANPDDIQAQPPERRPEEIQAQRPAPRDDDRPQLPDYDFRKRGSRWPEAWVWIIVGGSIVLMVLVFLGARILTVRVGSTSIRTLSEKAAANHFFAG